MNYLDEYNQQDSTSSALSPGGGAAYATAPPPNIATAQPSGVAGFTREEAAQSLREQGINAEVMRQAQRLAQQRRATPAPTPQAQTLQPPPLQRGSSPVAYIPEGPEPDRTRRAPQQAPVQMPAPTFTPEEAAQSLREQGINAESMKDVVARLSRKRIADIEKQRSFEFAESQVKRMVPGVGKGLSQGFEYLGRLTDAFNKYVLAPYLRYSETPDMMMGGAGNLEQISKIPGRGLNAYAENASPYVAQESLRRMIGDEHFEEVTGHKPELKPQDAFEASVGAVAGGATMMASFLPAIRTVSEAGAVIRAPQALGRLWTGGVQPAAIFMLHTAFMGGKTPGEFAEAGAMGIAFHMMEKLPPIVRLPVMYGVGHVFSKMNRGKLPKDWTDKEQLKGFFIPDAEAATEGIFFAGLSAFGMMQQAGAKRLMLEQNQQLYEFPPEYTKRITDAQYNFNRRLAERGLTVETDPAKAGKIINAEIEKSRAKMEKILKDMEAELGREPTAAEQAASAKLQKASAERFALEQEQARAQLRLETKPGQGTEPKPDLSSEALAKAEEKAKNKVEELEIPEFTDISEPKEKTSISEPRAPSPEPQSVEAERIPADVADVIWNRALEGARGDQTEAVRIAERIIDEAPGRILSSRVSPDERLLASQIADNADALRAMIKEKPEAGIQEPAAAKPREAQAFEQPATERLKTKAGIRDYAESVIRQTGGNYDQAIEVINKRLVQAKKKVTDATAGSSERGTANRFIRAGRQIMQEIERQRKAASPQRVEGAVEGGRERAGADELRAIYTGGEEALRGVENLEALQERTTGRINAAKNKSEARWLISLNAKINNEMRRREKAGETMKPFAEKGEAPRVEGRESNYIEPNTNKKIPVKYAVMELSDIIPSNDPLTFERDPRYPTQVQGRDYKKEQGKQQQVLDIARAPQPEKFMNTAPGAEGTPPAVTPQGFVLVGNGRIMGLKRAGKPGDYKAALLDRTADFGLDRAAVEGMKEPVLVRVMDQPPERWDQIAKNSDIPETTRKAGASEALDWARRVPDDVIDMIELREGETLGALLNDPKRSVPIMQRLVRSGAIPASQIDAFVTPDALPTKEMKAAFPRMILAKMFDPATVRRIEGHDTIENAVLGVAPDILRARTYEAEGLLPERLRLADQIEQAVTNLMDSGIRITGKGEKGWNRVKEDLASQLFTSAVTPDDLIKYRFFIEPKTPDARRMLREYMDRYLEPFAEGRRRDQAGPGLFGEGMDLKPEDVPTFWEHLRNTHFKPETTAKPRPIETKPGDLGLFSATGQPKESLKSTPSTPSISPSARFQAALEREFPHSKAEAAHVRIIADAIADGWASRGADRTREQWYETFIEGVGGEAEFRALDPNLSRESLKQIQAMHASPAEFEKFSTEFMKKGEGAHQFGWGLYFTDSAGVKQHYIDFFKRTRGQAATYDVAIHADRTPGEYDYILWRDRIADAQIDKVRRQLDAELSTLSTSSIQSTRLQKIRDQLDNLPALAESGYDMTGERFYRGLTSAFGSQREASLFLLRAGIDGIKFRADAGKGEGFNYVVFDPAAITIESKTLFQKGGKGQAAGAVRFADDGRAFIYALKNADASTAIHEIGHVLRRQLEVESRTSGEGTQQTADWGEASKWAAKSAKEPAWDSSKPWTRNMEEAFARAWERYLREGKAPTKALERVFASIKDMLRRVYARIQGSDIDVEISPELRDIFDRALTPRPPDTAIRSMPVGKAFQVGGETFKIRQFFNAKGDPTFRAFATHARVEGPSGAAELVPLADLRIDYAAQTSRKDGKVRLLDEATTEILAAEKERGLKPVERSKARRRSIGKVKPEEWEGRRIGVSTMQEARAIYDASDGKATLIDYNTGREIRPVKEGDNVKLLFQESAPATADAAARASLDVYADRPETPPETRERIKAALAPPGRGAREWMKRHFGSQRERIETAFADTTEGKQQAYKFYEEIIKHQRTYDVMVSELRQDTDAHFKPLLQAIRKEYLKKLKLGANKAFENELEKLTWALDRVRADAVDYDTKTFKYKGAGLMRSGLVFDNPDRPALQPGDVIWYSGQKEFGPLILRRGETLDTTKGFDQKVMDQLQGMADAQFGGDGAAPHGRILYISGEAPRDIVLDHTLQARDFAWQAHEIVPTEEVTRSYEALHPEAKKIFWEFFNPDEPIQSTLFEREIPAFALETLKRQFEIEPGITKVSHVPYIRERAETAAGRLYQAIYNYKPPSMKYQAGMLKWIDREKNIAKLSFEVRKSLGLEASMNETAAQLLGLALKPDPTLGKKLLPGHVPFSSDLIKDPKQFREIIRRAAPMLKNVWGIEPRDLDMAVRQLAGEVPIVNPETGKSERIQWQMHSAAYDELHRMFRPRAIYGEQSANKMRHAAENALSTWMHFMHGNLLLRPSTAVRNATSGSIQYSAKIIEDVWRAVATQALRGIDAEIKREGWDRVLADIYSIHGGGFLRIAHEAVKGEPFGVKPGAVPKALFERQTTISTLPSVGKGAGPIARAQGAALIPFNAVEVGFKRRAFAAEMSAHAEAAWRRALHSGAAQPREKAAFMAEFMSQLPGEYMRWKDGIIKSAQASGPDYKQRAGAFIRAWEDSGVYTFHYGERPAAMQKYLKDSSPGRLVFPFPDYMYWKYRLYGRYANPTNLISALSGKDLMGRRLNMSERADLFARAATGITLSGLAATAIAMLWDRIGRHLKTNKYSRYEYDTFGRIKIGENQKGEEWWLRVLDQPFIGDALLAALVAAGEASPDDWRRESINIGPAGSLALHFMGHKEEPYETYRDTASLMGQDIQPMTIPFHPYVQLGSQLTDPYVRKWWDNTGTPAYDTFWGWAEGVPGLREQLLARDDPATGQPMWRDPNLVLLNYGVLNFKKTPADRVWIQSLDEMEAQRQEYLKPYKRQRERQAQQYKELLDRARRSR